VLPVFLFIILISSICTRGRAGRVSEYNNGLLEPSEKENQKKIMHTHKKERRTVSGEVWGVWWCLVMVLYRQAG